MPRRRLSAVQRAQVARRANGCCEYCKSQERFSPDAFSVDHVVPRSRGGVGEVSNCAFACQGCNNAKYDHVTARDPSTGAEVALFNPRLERWADHFRWDPTFTRIIAVTATGRATLEALKLNRRRLQNLRKILREAGLHPPFEPQ